MERGWFVGDFTPSALKTQACEVALKNHKAGEQELPHYHRTSTELTLILAGQVQMRGQAWGPGDLVLIEPGEVTDFQAITDVSTVVVKVPGTPNDKFVVESSMRPMDLPIGKPDTGPGRSDCLIIPAHLGKFAELSNFLHGLVKKNPGHTIDFDTVLACSNHAELLFFERWLRSVDLNIPIHCIDLAAHVRTTHDRSLEAQLESNRHGCIINLKKFLALNWAAKSGYRWAACMDCDAICLRDCSGLFDHLKSAYADKKYWAGDIRQKFWQARNIFKQINRACVRCFPAAAQHLIEARTRPNHLYSWFFNIPTYCLEEFEEFESYMAEHNESLSNWYRHLNWYSFEHIIFSMWRVLAKDAVYIDYTDAIGRRSIPEDLDLSELMQIHEKYACRSAWISAAQTRQWETNSAKNRQDFYFGYHCDRV